ncbi:MAG: sulfotransferase, partial [Planctomycetota bacterium]
MKLDFLVAGFGKCGTTSLCSALADHPDIFIPKRKETAFFAFNHKRGWCWYESHFEDAHALQILGEGSGFY